MASKRELEEHIEQLEDQLDRVRDILGEDEEDGEDDDLLNEEEEEE